MTDDIVARLREQVKDTHLKYCEGRYSCDCGYNLKTEGLLELAADEIERLRAENERLLQEVSDLDNRMLEYEVERLRQGA
jgi:hypothetical protein